MSVVHRRGPPSLVRTLTLRLVLGIVGVMLLQAAFASIRDYYYQSDFISSYVRRESAKLASVMVARQSPGESEQSTRWPVHYTHEHSTAYAFRILDADGRVLAGHNAAMLSLLSPWTEKPSLRQDLWLRNLEPEQRMHFAGGVKHRREGKDYWVELATFGDPSNSYLANLTLDIIDDIWMPMLPLVALTLLVTTTSVRTQLAPMVKAATRADEIAVLERSDRLRVSELPEEASHFASAVNRLLDRVTDLVAAERLFIARAAHELRTPLSIMMLEISNLDHPKARQLETDVRSMSEIVDQLLSLARLEAAKKPTLGPVEISTVVRDLVSRMVAWAERDGHNLSLTTRFADHLNGDEATLRDAVRNLIENAVKHTPPGTDIRVEVTADGAIVVEDSGPGVGTLTPEELQQPFRKGSTTSDGAGLGLAIVRHAMELHGGVLSIDRSELGGARFVLSFPDKARIKPAA